MKQQSEYKAWNAQVQIALSIWDKVATPKHNITRSPTHSPTLQDLDRPAY